MARIRALKPEAPSHATLGRVSRDARLLFVWLLTEADDDGRFVAAPKKLAGNLFPHDEDVSGAEITRWMTELTREGLVRLYESGGGRFGLIVSWFQHQKPSHPAPSRLPEPPTCETENLPTSSGETQEESRSNSGGSPPSSSTSSSGSSSGTTFVEDRPSGSRPAASPRIPQSEIRLVFEHWQAVFGKPKAQLDKKREARIRWALERYSLDDVYAAIEGCKRSPHHMGQNDRGTAYNDLDVILRDAKHIEGFRDLLGPVAPGVDADGERLLAAARRGAESRRVAS